METGTTERGIGVLKCCVPLTRPNPQTTTMMMIQTAYGSDLTIQAEGRNLMLMMVSTTLIEMPHNGLNSKQIKKLMNLPQQSSKRSSDIPKSPKPVQRSVHEHTAKHGML